MKKITARIISAALAAQTLLFASCTDTTKDPSEYPIPELVGTTINVFNWGENISDGSDGSLDINKEFEDKYGINVNYTNYDSNEAMYAKLKSGAVSYDIIIPSDYMIERLINEDMLKKLDFSKIPNYSNIDPKYKDMFFDPNNEYSVPYTVGTVGLIYNKTMVDEVPDSWAVMWDENYKDDILTFNNPRDAFMIAQMLLGQDLNSTNKDDWDAAKDKLVEQMKIVQGRVMDEIYVKMPGENAAIAPYYAGDFLSMKAANDNLELVYPKEGTNVFVDSMCVPSNSQNFDAAMAYINFILEPEVGLANAEYICYASPNMAVVNNEEYSLKDSEILYPSDEVMSKTQYYHDLDPDIRSYYESLWEEVIRN